MIKSDAFNKAILLLQSEPLPEDAQQQLKALEKIVWPSERIAFGEIWETFELLAGPALY